MSSTRLIPRALRHHLLHLHGAAQRVLMPLKPEHLKIGFAAWSLLSHRVRRSTAKAIRRLVKLGLKSKR